MIINLISGPRNISTALMYSFANRPDTSVSDEPYYGVYLDRTGLEHPGRVETLAEQSTSEEEVTRQLMLEAQESPVFFIKNMAHHLRFTEKAGLPGDAFVFLIREPLEIIASYSKVIEHPTIDDLGLADQSKQLEQLVKSGKPITVLDSNDVLKDPEGLLTKLCAELKIPMCDEMLSWPQGKRSFDGPWAPYWYKSVWESTGFNAYNPTRRTIPTSLEPLRQEAEVHYRKLSEYKLK